MNLRFIVPGTPIALARSRHGKNGNVYTPQRSLNYQEEIWIAAMKVGARQQCFGDRPVWLGLQVFVKQPKHAAHRWPTSKPDLDNYTKQVMDAMKPCWHDDAQVVGYLSGSGKFFAGGQRIECGDGSVRVFL